VGVVTTVELEEGAPVVLRRADAEDAHAVRGAAERLRHAVHPGVAAVRRCGPAGTGWELVTDHVGPPLTAHRVRTPARLAVVAAIVADTLAALHDRGIVHGRLAPAHVLLGRDGRAVLCGLGATAPGALGPADDVAALGSVVLEVLARLDPTREAEQARALAAVAERATDRRRERRPSARRLATDLAAVAVPDRRPPAAVRRAVPVVVAAVGLAPVLALVLRTAAAAPSAERTAPPVTTAPAGAASGPGETVPEPACVARAGRPLVAARCGTSVVVEGASVVVDGVRTVVGGPGDVVVAGDWGCEGTVRPAVLRPATGEVLVLSAADASAARHVEAAARVPGAEALPTAADAAGCPQLLVATEHGRSPPPFVTDRPQGARVGSPPWPSNATASRAARSSPGRRVAHVHPGGV
jgi:eukaryotic-like serine/threonine-protein kinase